MDVRERSNRKRRTHAREAESVPEPLVIPPLPATVAERVAFIADLMEALRWERGKTGPKIEEVWGLSVKQYAAEASRLVTADADDARRDITAGCRKLFRDAVAGGDAKSAKAVGELWADVAGAKAPEKHQIGSLEDLTPAKAREVMSETFSLSKKSGDGE